MYGGFGTVAQPHRHISIKGPPKREELDKPQSKRRNGCKLDLNFLIHSEVSSGTASNEGTKGWTIPPLSNSYHIILKTIYSIAFLPRAGHGATATHPFFLLTKIVHFASPTTANHKCSWCSTAPREWRHFGQALVNVGLWTPHF